MLSGVRGQTFLAPTDRIDRIDITLDTRVQPGSEPPRVYLPVPHGLPHRPVKIVVVTGKSNCRCSGGMAMAEKGDKAHIAIMEEMRKGMNDPNAVKDYMERKQEVFDALREDK